jgi:hypothetical protein
VSAIISVCYESLTIRLLYHLSATDEVRNAFLAAAAAMDSIGVFDESTEKARTAKGAIASAETRLKECFTAYGVREVLIFPSSLLT